VPAATGVRESSQSWKGLAFYDFPAEHWKHLRTTSAAWRWRLLSCGAIRTNKPAPRPLAIPLRTSESWRPSVAGYEHARGR